jgi:hypothetical protein
VRGRPASLIVVPAYLALTLVLLAPLVAEFDRSIPAIFGALDPLLQSFLLGWNWRTLAADPGALVDLPIFHPHERALTYMDHLIGEAVLAWPIRALTGNGALAYNVLVVLSFVLSGWFTYRLARGLGFSRAASFIAGAAFALGPYRLCNLGNLNQLQTQFLPLGLHFAFRFYRGRRMRDLGAALGVLALQSWFGWYYFFHLAVLFGLVVLWELAVGRLRWSGMNRGAVAALLVATVAIILPSLWPYLEQQRAMPEFKRTLGMTALWSADVLDYVKVPLESAWARVWPPGADDQGYWPGFVAVPLALIGLREVLRGRLRREPPPEAVRRDLRRGDAGMERARWRVVRLWQWCVVRARAFARATGDAGAVALIGAVGFVLSLGPVLQVAGVRTMLPLPFAVAFFVVPGFSSMRAPGRFSVLVLLAAAVLAAAGLDAVRRRFGRRLPDALLAPLLAVALLAGAWPERFPLTDHPDEADMPAVYRLLAAQPDRDPLLEIPVPKLVTDENPTHARRQHWLLYHGHPRLDGVSGFVPPDDDILRLTLQGFPRERTLESAWNRGARWIIVHYGDYAPDRAEALRKEVAASSRLALVDTAGSDALYRLSSP